MSSSSQQSTSTSTAVGEVGRRVLGTLRLGGRLGGRLGLRVGGGALERLRPVVERGLSVSPGTRGSRSSDHPGTPDRAPEVPDGSLDSAPTAPVPEVTPADVAARVAPRPGASTASEQRRTTPSAPGDRLPPRRPAPAPEPVRPADS